MVDQRIKDRAYQLDPECWVSYSGKPKEFKRAVERRRTASLDLARIQLEAEGEPDLADDGDDEFANSINAALLDSLDDPHEG